MSDPSTTPQSLPEKFALQSKTILAVILAFIVNVGPFIGLTFSEQDAVMITEAWDAVLNSIAIILGIIGRHTANSTIRWNPFNASTVNSFTLLPALLLLMLLGACAQLGPTPQTTSQRFYVVVESYLLLREEAEAYATSGPLCSERDVLGCVNDKAVIALDDVTDQFDPRIALAVALFEAGPVEAETQAEQLRLARQALRELSAALAKREG